MEFSSQRKDMLLFLTINMAAMTSCTNPQLVNTVSDNQTRCPGLIRDKGRERAEAGLLLLTLPSICSSESLS